MRRERTDWQIFEITTDSDKTVRKRYYRGLIGHGPSHAASTASGKLLTRWFWMTSWATRIGETRVPSGLNGGRARWSASWRHDTGNEIKEEKKAEPLFVCYVEELFNVKLMGTNKGIEKVDLTLTGRMEGEHDWSGSEKGRDLTCYNKFLVAGEGSRQRRWHYFI
jgi:hypothetical protein